MKTNFLRGRKDAANRGSNMKQTALCNADMEEAGENWINWSFFLGEFKKLDLSRRVFSPLPLANIGYKLWEEFARGGELR